MLDTISTKSHPTRGIGMVALNDVSMMEEERTKVESKVLMRRGISGGLQIDLETGQPVGTTRVTPASKSYVSSSHDQNVKC